MIMLNDAEATRELGFRLGEMLERGDVVALEGPLGSGKTVFAAGMLSALGFAGDVPSPSFPIAIPYDPPLVRLPMLHVDLYRVERDDEIEELGLDDARAEGALIVEWPERLGRQASADALSLTLAVHADGRRALTARVPLAWEARWPPR